MKKLLIIMLVFTFVLAAATAAIAGRGRWDNISDTAGAPNYIKYSALNSSFKSPTGDPHGGYLTSTNLCSFCHAVHNAGTDGDGTGVYKLTRSSTSTILGACNYCHYTGGIATKKPYDTSGYGAQPVRAEHRINGSATIVPDASNTTVALNDGVLDCFDCHNAAPHGAGEVYRLTKDVGAGVGNVTPICKRCHTKNYTTSFDAVSHPMVTAGQYRGGRTVVDPGIITSQCTNCHANVADKGLFPHTSNAARFLDTSAGDLNTAGTGGSLDVICLNCHKWNAGGSGVGVTF